MRHQKRDNLGRLLGVILTLLFSIPSVATLPKIDPDAPIQIQSDHAYFEQKIKQAIHEGNVVLIQGSHQLQADKLIAKKDPKGDLTVITATGKPASFKGRMESDPHPVYATAKTIYYYPDKQLIVLEGSATIDHQQDKFKGPILSYQIDKQIVSAKRQSNERPTITIQPRNNSHHKS